MSLSNRCKIFVENYTGVFFNGATIVGRVEFYVAEPVSIRAIELHLKCKEHIELSGYDNYYDANERRYKPRKENYTSDSSIFQSENIIFGSKSGNQQMEPGNYVYKFSLVLLKDIPSTFHGKCGSVYYMLKAVVDVPFAIDYDDKFFFDVKSLIDLNTFEQNCFSPTVLSDESTWCCLCCKGGVMTMNAELPKTAYMPGERIKFRVKITNMTNFTIDSLLVTLKKHVIYTRNTGKNSRRKDVVEEIVNFQKPGVGAHNEHTYDDLQLVIPEELEVPNLNKCSFIEIYYSLTLKGRVASTPTMDLKIKIRPKFGHVHTNPYQQVTQPLPEPFYPMPTATGYAPIPGFVPYPSSKPGYSD